MDDSRRDQPAPRGLKEAPPSLRAAVRRARVEQAERSDVVAELRGAELARLEMLHESLKPILAQVPDDIDLFDAGIAPGERPRLFVDMIAFVEMGPDRRTYRFVQETRHGRVAIAESDRVDPMVDEMTNYIARRLVERELALAADRSAPPVAARPARDAQVASGAAAPAPVTAGEAEAPARNRPFATALLFTIELLGSIVLFAIVIAALYFGWKFVETYWVANFQQLR